MKFKRRKIIYLHIMHECVCVCVCVHEYIAKNINLHGNKRNFLTPLSATIAYNTTQKKNNKKNPPSPITRWKHISNNVNV